MESPLINKLMECAKAVADADLKLADSLFGEMQVLKAVETDEATKKVVHYFAEALARRVHGVHPKYAQPLFPSVNIDYYEEETFSFECFAQAFYLDATRHLSFPYEKMRLRVINFSGYYMNYGGWFYFMNRFHYSSLQLIRIGPKLSLNNECFQKIHQVLTDEAQQLSIDFELRQFEADSVSDLVQLVLQLERTNKDEALIVSWSFELHKLLALEGAVEKVLSKLKDLNPDLMVIIEQDANHNVPDFFDRFTLSFQYYITLVKSILERKIVLKNQLTWEMEMYLRRQISNVVAREGIDRVERHETKTSWMERLRGAGFQLVPESIINFCGIYYTLNGYKLKTENGIGVLSYNDRSLVFKSYWKPSTNPAANQFHDGDERKISNSGPILRGGDLPCPITTQNSGASPSFETQVVNSSDFDDVADANGSGFAFFNNLLGGRREPITHEVEGVKKRKEVLRGTYYKGVGSNSLGKYDAERMDSNKKAKICLGTFYTEVNAALAYDRAAFEVHGSKA